MPLSEPKTVIAWLVSVVIGFYRLEAFMAFPKWGGLTEVAGVKGMRSLPSVYLSAADALRAGVNNEVAENYLTFIKEMSLKMQGTYKGIDSCLNATIAAANSHVYDDVATNFYRKHGKTVEQAIKETNEALRKLKNLPLVHKPTPKLTADFSWRKVDPDETTVFPVVR